MEPIRKLPDPMVCRTRQLFGLGYYLCLVEAPIAGPQLSVIRGFHLCNHYFRANFVEKKDIGRNNSGMEIQHEKTSRANPYLYTSSYPHQQYSVCFQEER